MIKTNISELIDFYFTESHIEHFLPYVKETVLNLCLQVRESSLIEASEKADADYNWINNVTDIEVYVLKESILGLDKNSIEL